MTYSQLLFADVRNKVEKRKHQIQVEMSNLISANFNVYLFLSILFIVRLLRNGYSISLLNIFLQ